MNSVYIIAFFLLRASFCTAIKERSTRAGWTEQPKEITYLALVKYEKTGTDVGLCSGSIPSESTVLTYCRNAAQGNKAYAGLVNVADATDSPTGNVQLRVIDSVVEEDHMKELKICKVNKWNLNDHVRTVTLNYEKSPFVVGCKVAAFRKKDNAATAETAHEIAQAKIGGADLCSEVQATKGLLYSKAGLATVPGLPLGKSEQGGPAVCSDKQWAIIIRSKKLTPAGSDEYYCYLYVDIAYYSEWIDKQINPAVSDEPSGSNGTSGGSNGTSGGSNGTDNKPSSAYSIHSYLYKYSNWKVILLCLLAIKILVY